MTEYITFFKSRFKIKNINYIYIIIACFGIIYTLISLVNHYNFRTYALDLGLYTNATYKYGHFQMGDNFMIKENFEYILGGHFDLYLMLFSPLIYLFGSYTLLIVQIAAILFGGIGVFKFFKYKYENKTNIAYFAMIYFYMFFGIYSALSFDYHSTVVASSLIPWLFYLFNKKKYLYTSIILLLILISQENISLWIVFICIGLMIENRKDKQALTYLSAFAVVSLLYFIVVIKYIIPAFSETGKYGGFAYTVLGNNPVEALLNFILHPLNDIKILFVDPNHSLYINGVKGELHTFLLLSGIYLLILKPQYIIMLIPIYVQKLFHNYDSMWGVCGQYSIEFTPILALGVFSVISELKQKTFKKIMIVLTLIGVLYTTVKMMDKTIQWQDKTRIRIYKAEHYKRDYNVRIVHQKLNAIPRDAKVSALSPFIPFLALRNNIYQFPIIKDADYIVYSFKEVSYPVPEKDFASLINEIENSHHWEIEYKDDNITILKKIN